MKQIRWAHRDNPWRTIWNSLWITFLLLQNLFSSAGAQGLPQNLRVRFDRLTIEDGLSQNTVHAILQDQLGFMWFGTDEGLNRYDGYTFLVYQHDPVEPGTLGGTSVLSLLEDRQGRLWVGTNEGLDRYNRAEDTFQHITSSSEPFGPVLALAEDAAGNLWLGTAAKGLWVLEARTGSLQHYLHLSQDPNSLASNAVYALLCARSGEMWIATDAGVARYFPKTGTFQHYPYLINNPNSLSGSRARAILETRDGSIWVGLDGAGLNRLDPQTGQFTFYLHSQADPNSLSDDRVRAIYEDHQGALWVGTMMGLNRFEREKGRFAHFVHQSNDPQSLGGSRIFALHEDRSGVLWIGTDSAGVSFYRPAAHRFWQYPLATNDAESPIIQAIAESPEGQLWLGTMQTGLYRLDRDRQAWETFQHRLEDPTSLASQTVSALALDPKGNLWIGVPGRGLDRFDPGTVRFSHYRGEASVSSSLSSNNVSALLVDQSGRLWVGTQDAGLNRMETQPGVFRHYRNQPQDPNSLNSDRVSVLYQDRQGALWVGTSDAGLNLLEPGSNEFKHYRHNPQNPNSLSSDNILSIWEAPQGVIWIGTSEGLNRLDRSGSIIRRYSVHDGLPSSMISCIRASADGKLWISTVNGLARFDPQTGIFRTYTVDDGLQSREFLPGACYQNQSGELFFGGVQGFNAFSSGEVVDQQEPSPVVITAFKKHNQTVLWDLTGGETVQLSYQDDLISFEFSALDYNSHQKNRYAYQLVGFDPGWVDAGERRFASYTNLKSGKYTFRVRAANSDGIWDEAGTAVAITVTPPVWERGWFHVSAALLLLGLLYGGYHLRVSSIQRRNLELEQKVTELTQQVKEAAIAAERSRLARDLHDSVTQSLYSLVLMAEAGQRTLAAGQLEESRSRLARVGQIAQQALQEMRLMVFELRRPALQKAGLRDALAYRLEAVERRSGIQARLVTDGELALPPWMEEELYSLIQEALNNALKHSGADVVTVQLIEKAGQLTLEVRDTGCGFDLQHTRHNGGYGLTSMRERAERLGGLLIIQSAPGRGTCVQMSFTVPQNGETSQGG